MKNKLGLPIAITKMNLPTLSDAVKLALVGECSFTGLSGKTRDNKIISIKKEIKKQFSIV